MPVLAFRFLKVDLFPTLSDQVCCTAGESLKGWFLVLGSWNCVLLCLIVSPMKGQ